MIKNGSGYVTLRKFYGRKTAIQFIHDNKIPTDGIVLEVYTEVL